MLKYCKCGSLIIDEICTNRACAKTSQKRKSWKIGDSIVKFGEYLTYAEALEKYKKSMNDSRQNKNSKHIYYY